MLQVVGIDHVVLRVRDAEAALAFYSGVLGCPVEKRNDGIGLIHLRAGDSLIDLVPLEHSALKLVHSRHVGSSWRIPGG